MNLEDARLICKDLDICYSLLTAYPVEDLAYGFAFMNFEVIYAEVNDFPF